MKQGTTNWIGFTNKFFTLWRVTQFKNANGGWTINYNYVQNLSQDEEKARAKFAERYPDKEVNIDLGLRGESNWSKEYIPEKLMNFGKYKYTPIADVTDIDYLCWFYGETTKKRREIVKAILLADKRVKYNKAEDSFTGPERLAKEKEWAKERAAKKRKAKTLDNHFGFHGEDGSREEMTCKVVGAMYFDTDWGTSFKLTLQATDKKVYVYWGAGAFGGNTYRDWIENDKKPVKVTFKGTLEHKHDNYTNRDTTYIKRPTLVAKKTKKLQKA